MIRPGDRPPPLVPGDLQLIVEEPNRVVMVMMDTVCAFADDVVAHPRSKVRLRRLSGALVGLRLVQQRHLDGQPG